MEVVDGILYSASENELIKYPAGKTDKTFVIPDNIEIIGEKAFEGAKNLESVVCNDMLTGIEGCAFANCTSLKNIEFNDALQYIYDDALENTNIEQIYIPKNFDEYDVNSLEPLSKNLKAISVSPENKNFVLENGILFNSDKTVLYKYLSCLPATSYTVPDTVTRISYSAFMDCANLEHIYLGENVDSIYGGAFENCTNLKDFAFNNKVTSVSEVLFKNCSSLAQVDLKGIEYIECDAFYGCKSLESVTIPATTNCIYSGVFQFCDSLKSINVEEGNSYYRTFDDCLYVGNTLIEYPNAKASAYTIPSEAEEIGNSAFSGRTSLTDIVIPDNITYVSDSAFCDCISLKNVTLSKNINEIHNSAFSNCKSLETIELPKTLTSIYSNAFGNCKSLKNVKFAYDISYVWFGSSVFCNAGIEEITIPSNFSFDYTVFLGCYNLRKVKFLGNSYNYSPYISFFNLDDITIYYPNNNASWTSDKMLNYEHKDSLKWIAYEGEPTGDVGTYTFTGLEPNSEYTVGIHGGSNTIPGDDLYSYYYFDQYTSDSNGTITMHYCLSEYYEDIKRIPFVLGEAKYDISEATIEIENEIYFGKNGEKPKNYSVTANGEELVEGIDYFVQNSSGYEGTGCYKFYISGAGNWSGSNWEWYYVTAQPYDADCNGVVNINDATAIQMHIAGIRELAQPDEVDANGDGEITIADVTVIQKLLVGLPV